MYTLVIVISKLFRVNPTDVIYITLDETIVQVPKATVQEELAAKLTRFIKIIWSLVFVISVPGFKWIGLLTVNLIVE